jgi:SpoIID/LytB domain protein
MVKKENELISIEHEPTVSVGLITTQGRVRFELKGEFQPRLDTGNYEVSKTPDGFELRTEAGSTVGIFDSLKLEPATHDCSFIIKDILIGIDFHWERKQDQEFTGNLVIKPDAAGNLLVINELPVEDYLSSVISSEMSATSHPELLKAHSIISRSWLLAQMKPWKSPRRSAPGMSGINADDEILIRWYDQESHTDFDVCADDHCQRYQGISMATTSSVHAAIDETCGKSLVYDGKLCDARFSKSCGGMTEDFRAAWDDQEIRYLTAFYDGEKFPPEFNLPMTNEINAQDWILGNPPAFCNSSDAKVIKKILPDFDQETVDFYRWRVTLNQDELQGLLKHKLGIDFGRIISLQPVERGRSGRIVKLKITGELRTLTIGKELEIRRALSKSHLYSSAFVIKTEQGSDGFPDKFHLTGAGWGHGVGLCQIGAALMAEKGYNYTEILAHYYPGASIERLYERRRDYEVEEEITKQTK